MYITGEVPNYQAGFAIMPRIVSEMGSFCHEGVAWNESIEPIRALGIYTDIDDAKRAELSFNFGRTPHDMKFHVHSLRRLHFGHGSNAGITMSYFFGKKRPPVKEIW